MKKFSLLVFFLAINCYIRADYFEKLPYTIKQPDGQVISCFISGDEFYVRIHDSDNYTIVQAPDGYYYYALQDGNNVKPSTFIAGRTSPLKAGLKKGVGISSEEYRNRFESMNNFRSLKKSGSGNGPHTGTLNNIVIYLRFSDDPEFTQPRKTFTDLFNSPMGISLKSYFLEVSYNKLDVTSLHYPRCDPSLNISYMDYRERAFFEPYNETTNPKGYKNFDERTLREHSLIADAITWINTQSPVPAELDLDSDSDGYVDNVCFIIRGSTGSWNELLWAHRWMLFSKEILINGKKVYNYIFQPESQISVRTLCHEMFHTLGAPDLYHYGNQGFINPVGSWDIMETGNGHMTAYMKWKYSGSTWIREIREITQSGTYMLNPLTSPDMNCYMIKSPFSDEEYYVLEYRRKSGYFEANLPGSGLIVSRVNPSKNGNSEGPPDEIYVYRPGGSTISNGDYTEAFLSSASGRTSITDDTNPAGFLQDGNPGGLYISDIREDGSQVVFNVTIRSNAVLATDADTISNGKPSEAHAVSHKYNNSPEFTLYPNPCNGIINLRIADQHEPVSIDVRDIRGNLVYSSGPAGIRQDDQLSIDLNDKASGVYIVELRSSKWRRTGKFLKL